MSDGEVLFFSGAALIFVLGIPVPRTWRNVLLFAVIAFAVAWMMSSGLTSMLDLFE